MDEYDDLLARVRSGSTVPAAPAAPKMGEYDSLLKQVRSPDLVPAQAAIYNGSFSNPAQAAERINLARDIKKMLGEDISPSIVDPVEDRRRIQQAEMDHGIRQSASLRKWIEDDPWNAGLIGQKDIGYLLTVDGALNAGRRALGSAAAGLTADPAAAFYTTAAMPFKLGEQAAGLVLPDWMAQSEMGKALLWAARASKATGDVAAGTRGNEGNIEAGVYSGFRSLGGNLGTMLTGGMLGLGAKGTTALMSAIAGGGSALKAFDQGTSATTVLTLGLADTAAEYATELPGMKALLAAPGLKQGMMSFARAAANFGIKEMLGEQVATVWQDFNEWALLNPEKTLDDFLAARPDAAIQTAVATIVGGGGQIVIQQAMVRGRQAETRALFDALHEGAQNSELLKAVPEKYREFVKKATAEGGIDTVFIPAEQFTTYFQSRDMDPAAIAKELGASNYAEAMGLGSDVMIPMDAFATLIAGTDHYAGLADDLRLSQGDLTARELALAEANKDASLEKMQADIERIAAESDTSLNAQIKQITDDVALQLGARYDQKTSETMAQVMRGIAVLTARDVQGKVQAEGRTASEAEIQQAISAQLAKYDIRINPNPLLPEILTKRPNFKAEIDPMLDMIRAGQGPSEQDIFGTSLVDFIRERGGLAPVGELQDVEKIKTPAFKAKLIQDLGKRLDEMAMVAVEAGYFPGVESGQLTETQLVEAILNELGGAQKTFAGFDEQKLNMRETLEGLSKALDQYGLDPKTMDNEAIKAALFAEPTYEQAAEKMVSPDNLKRIQELTAEARAWRETRIKAGDDRAAWDRANQRLLPIAEELGRLTGHPLGLDDAETAARFAGSDQEFKPDQSLIDSAVKEFGYTQNPGEAGYILPNGKMLKFGEGGVRGEDHRAISIAFPVDEKPSGYSDAMIEFMNRTGAARVDFNSGLFEMQRIPTEAQMRTAIRAAKESGVGILAQASRPDGSQRADLDMDRPSVARLAAFFQETAEGRTFFQKVGAGGTAFKAVDTESAAFKAWFGGSKVVDADGKPLVVYHGTAGDHNEFDDYYAGSVSSGVGIGFWFAKDRAYAHEYSENAAGIRGEDARIMHVYLRVENPLVVEFNGDGVAVVDGNEMDWTSNDDAIKYAKRNGNDGIDWVHGSFTDSPSFVAFRPEQIKSATSNTGAFSRDNPSILYQPAYHGSPHKFDRFTLDHIGKGEGAQAYGWGLYFAGEKEIAEYYKNALSIKSVDVRVNGRRVPGTVIAQHADTVARAKGRAPTRDEVIAHMADRIDAIDTLPSLGFRQSPLDLAARVELLRGIEKVKNAKSFDVEVDGTDGQLYEVEIPEDGEYLLWDKPLSEQPEKVREAIYNSNIAAIGKDALGWRGAPEGMHEKAMARMGGEQFYRDLAQAEGGDEAASKYLNSLGIAGIKYLDGTSRTKGEGSFNYVIFDENAVKVLQTFYQNENRAQIRIGADRKINIDLLKTANFSSFLHETGHFYLEFLGDLAENGSQQTKDDYAKILKWFGIASRDQVTVEHHEMFARANERYLMEGKAPSKDLRAAFARFKAWLTSIYHNLTELHVPLTDEVREVFDRIYATDAEIAAARAENDFIDTFVTAEQMGVSQAEFDAYKKQAAGEIQEGTDELRNKIMRVQRLKREAWWREELAKTKDEVGAELDAMKEYQTFDALSEKDSELKIDRQDLIERYGATILKRLPRGYGEGKGAIYTAADERGSSVETVAQLMGYASGDTLIEDMANLKPRRKLIAAEADARMNERYGDILNSIEIADEAQESLHNEARGKKLAMEVRALNKAIGRALIDPEAVMREAARRVMAEKLIRNVRPNDYLIAERKANREAFKAMAENNRIEAFEAKQRELLNFAMYREATLVKDEMKKLHDFVARFEKGPMREKLGKAGEQYLEAAQAILEDVELTNKSLKAIDRTKLRQWLQMQENADLYVTEDMVSGTFAKNWKDLTVEEMRAISDALRNIGHVAGRQLKIMSGQRMIDLQEAVDGAVASAVAANKLQPQQLSKPVNGFGDAFMDWMGDLLNVRTMATWLDGGKADGWWHTVLINRASEAQVEYYKLIRSIVMPVNEMVEKYMDAKGKSLDDVFQTSVGPVTRGQALSIGFNLGNSSNKDKMIRGGMPKWGADGQVQKWTESDINQIVGNLDAADWNFVQSIWTMLDTQMYPAINELEKRVNGVPLKKVEAVPFEITTKDGQTLKLQGGYYPMSYDPRFSDAGKKQDAGPLAGLIEGNFAYVTTPKGQTKARIESFARPANLDFSSVLGRHLSQSILDLTHREFFMDAQKFLRQPKIRQTLQERLGDGFEKEFNNWLKRIANQGANSPTESMTRSARVAEQLRTNTTVLFLGFKITTILAQFAGLGNSVERIGAGWMWRGTQEAFSNPAKAMKMVMEKSGRMQQRWNTLDQSIYEAMGRLHRSKLERARDAVNRAAFAGIAIADRLVSTPTWIGAYRQAKAEGVTEENAIHAADDAVISSQGDGASMELSKIQGERGFTRLFTVFYTPFAAQFNRLYTAGRKMKQGGIAYTPEFVMRAVLITMIPAIIADLLTGRGPQSCEIDDAECFAKWGAVKGLSSLLATVPFIREGGQMLEQSFEGNYKPDLKYSPVFSAIERAGGAAKQTMEVMAGEREMTDEVFFKDLESSGLVLGLPTAQVAITGEYLWDLLSGEDSGDTWYKDLFMRRKVHD